MWRCIENAIEGRHITREQGEALQADIETRLRHGLAPDLIKVQISDEMVAKAKDKKRRALLQEQKRQILTEAFLNHRNAKGENDPAQALWLVLERYGEVAQFEDVETRKWVIMRRTHSMIAELLNEFRKGAFTGDLRRVKNPEVVARMDNVVRELFGHGTGDAKAEKLAQSFARASEYLRLRSNQAGTSIRRLDSWGMAQRHDPEALLNIGQLGWVDYLMRDGVLDRTKMVSPMSGEQLSDDELREALMEVWKTITSRGMSKLEPSYAAYGKGSLAKRQDDYHRFLHFQGPDQWLAYMRDFKAGDPFEAMMAHVAVMSRDIATLEILGPNPEAMRNYLKQLVLKHADETRPVQAILRDERARLGQLLERSVGKDVAGEFSDRFKLALQELADLELQLKAKGGEDATLKAAAARAAKAVDALEERLKLMEPVRVGEERAAKVADAAAQEQRLAQIDTEIAGIRSQPGPMGRMSQRNRQRLDRLAAERTRVEAAKAKADEALDLFDQGDRSVFAEEPALLQEVMDSVDRMKREVRKIRAGGWRSVADPTSKAQSAIVQADKMWELQRGTEFAPVSVAWANGLQTARNVLTARLLGSAMVTALADLGTQRLARKFVGMDKRTLNFLGSYLSLLKNADRTELVEAGLMLDTAVHNMHQHATYLDGAGLLTNKAGSWGSWKTLGMTGTKSVQWSGFVADRVIAASGLSWHTQVSKWLFGSQMQADLGRRTGKAWGDLEPAWRRTLERHLISEKDWDAMRKATLYSPHDATTWLRPQEVAAAAGDDVAERYLAMIHRETRHAVIEGTVRSRTWMGAGGRRGTLAGELTANMSQFKSFGAAYMILHMGRMMREFQTEGRVAGMSMLAQYAVTLTIMGVIVNEIYEMINFRDPILPRLLAQGKVPGAEYWFRGLTKAGGIGLIGDVITAPMGYGGGMAGILAGPVGSQAERFRSRIGGDIADSINFLEHESGVIGDEEYKKRKEGKTARNIISSVKELTPGTSLWYLRGAMDKLVWAQLQQAFDPNAKEVFKRHEQLQKKRSGNGYWWHSGDLAPSRWPMTAPDNDWKSKGRQPKAPAEQPAALSPAAQQRVANFNFEIGQKLVQSDKQRFAPIDGDTLEAGGQRWRLTGFDAPEIFSSSQTGGERQAGVKAALRLKELVLTARNVELQVAEKPDRWGRGRAKLTIDGVDAGDILVREGLAKKKTMSQRAP